MAIDIKATCDALQDIVVQSALIRSAPSIAQWPEGIDDSDLPLSLVRPTAGDWSDKQLPRLGRLGGATLQYEARRGTYAVDVYVMNASFGTVYEGVDLTLQIIADVGARLDNALNLGLIAGGQSVKDSGLLILKWATREGTVEYRGTRFIVEVLERSA